MIKHHCRKCIGTFKIDAEQEKIEANSGLLIKIVFVCLLNLLLSLNSFSQYCENFDSTTKAILDSIGWDYAPNHGFAISTPLAYSGRSAIMNAGIGNHEIIGTGCHGTDSTWEHMTFVYRFINSTGLFRVGIQDYNTPLGIAVNWLDTLPVVNIWTSYSRTFPVPPNAWRIVFYFDSYVASGKLGIDNFCLDNSHFLGDCTLLSVELIDFDAELIPYTSSTSGTVEIAINWQTQSELNSDYFELLRSTDLENFERITTIQAAGYSIMPLSYNFSDQIESAPVYYYQLKMVDMDGSVQYSPISVVRIAEASEWIFSNGVLNYYGERNSTIKICTISGVVQLNEEVEPSSSISLTSLEPGIYLIYVNSGTLPFAKIYLPGEEN